MQILKSSNPQILKSSNPQILKSSKSSVKTLACLSSALFLATQTSFAAITAGNPSDITSLFTVTANGANCDIAGVFDGSTQGSGGATTNPVGTLCTGDGTQVGTSIAACSNGNTSTFNYTKPTTSTNVGVLYFKKVGTVWQRYPGWFTLDSSCNTSSFYYEGCLDATMSIGATTGGVDCPASPLPVIVNAPIDLNMNKPVETFATEIEIK